MNTLASLCKRTDSPEASLFTLSMYGCRRRIRQKLRPLVPLYLSALKFKEGFCAYAISTKSRELSICGSRGGGGTPPPPEKIKSYRFSEQYWSGSLAKSQSYQASTQCWAIIGPPAKRHLTNKLRITRQTELRVYATESSHGIAVGLLCMNSE